MAFSLKCKPCEYTRISQPYKAGRHRGIDLVNHKLYQKTPIRAAQDGKVVAAKDTLFVPTYTIFHVTGEGDDAKTFCLGENMKYTEKSEGTNPASFSPKMNGSSWVTGSSNIR